MSHYTVAIFTSTEDQSIEELLAPYDENIKVEPYINQMKSEFIQSLRDGWIESYGTKYSEWQKDPEGYEKNSSEGHIEYLKSLPEKMKMSDEEIYKEFSEDREVDEDGNILSTYNPNSRWDWYSVGGRWNDILISKEGSKEDDECYCDASLVSNIDFEKMERENIKELTPYEEAVTNSFYKEEYMRERYPSEEEYIKRNTQFSTYAVITPDGEWHAPGSMGWFGCSSETVDEEREWDLNYHERFIKPAIENGWYITIVDCHI